MPTAKLISITPNYMDVLKVACGKPYGNNVGLKGIQKIIERGHLSVLEHCHAVFEVECSVRVLGQLTRHRHLSFTVKSSRGSEFAEMTTPNLHGLFQFEGCNQDFYFKDGDTYYGSMHEQMLSAYKQALENGMSYEDAAYLLPQGAMTSMVISGNFRAWYEYLPKRLCARALAEHQDLAKLILDGLQSAAPEIFEGSFMNCENCKEGSCKFK